MDSVFEVNNKDSLSSVVEEISEVFNINLFKLISPNAIVDMDGIK